MHCFGRGGRCPASAWGQRFGWPEGDPLSAFLRLFLADWWGGQRGNGRDQCLGFTGPIAAAMAVVVGVALSTSGVALQALLRNPLAEPFILGLSSGAGVGIMLQALLGHYWEQHLGPVHVGAWLGAVGSMGVVYLAGRRKGVIDPLGLLLVGVVLGTIHGAVIMLLNYLAGSSGVGAKPVSVDDGLPRRRGPARPALSWSP